MTENVLEKPQTQNTANPLSRETEQTGNNREYTRLKPGPSCSKHRQLNELVNGQNVNCSSKYNL